MSRPPAGTIRLLWFASLAEAAGRREEGRAVEPGQTIGALWEQLVAERPALARGGRPAFACNGNLASRDDRVSPGDTIAFLPPVSGG
jgi:molybdopterin synthase sulfur carrier subunit